MAEKEAEQLSEVVVGRTVFLEFQENCWLIGHTRTKEAVSIRLDQDLVAKLRASGPGWQSRVNEALRHWIDKGAA